MKFKKLKKKDFFTKYHVHLEETDFCFYEEYGNNKTLSGSIQKPLGGMGFMEIEVKVNNKNLFFRVTYNDSIQELTQSDVDQINYYIKKLQELGKIK